MSFRIGIDVGGTFTDFLVVPANGDGARFVHKTSSTPDDPSRAVVEGLAEIAEQLGLSRGDFFADVEVIVHGTTVTTNAVLTHRGARTGLLTTRGFRDALALRDGTREEPYNNRMQPPTPLVPRYLRLPATERVDFNGDVVQPLDDTDVRAAAQTFVQEGVEAVAVSFMHSPAHGAHERQALELLRDLMPDAYLTASSDLLSQVRFYDRTSTTVLNAYVGPIITRYLRALTSRLEELEFGGVLLIMQSNGGVATPAELAERAALSLLSGPASGPTAGLWLLEPHGRRDCITIDMGGTSFDTALVKDGQPLVMTDGLVDRWRLALPTIDIHTIGAGGGSLAYLDEGGLLHVGPASAGAVPGPVCYGRGGTEPTVTDADLLLGYLGEGSFRAMRLDRAAAETAMSERIARVLGLSVEEAAAGVYDLVNVAMAAGVREVSVRRGLDPRDFPLVVAGGAGPLHAAAIASELEIPLLLVPRESSIFCAAGMLMSDFKHDDVRAYKSLLSGADLGWLGQLFEEMAAAGRATLARERIAAENAKTQAALDLRYVGQWHELTVPIQLPVDLEQIAGEFHRQHDLLFGYSSPAMPVELLAARVTTLGRTDKPAIRDLVGGERDSERALRGSRPVWSRAARGMVSTAVYDGTILGAGATLAGPAVVELMNTTIVVLERFDLVVDRFGSFILYAGARGRDLAEELAPDLAELIS